MRANQKNRSLKLAILFGGALIVSAIVLPTWYFGFSRDAVGKSNEQPGNLLEATHYQD